MQFNKTLNGSRKVRFSTPKNIWVSYPYLAKPEFVFLGPQCYSISYLIRPFILLFVLTPVKRIFEGLRNADSNDVELLTCKPVKHQRNLTTLMQLGACR